MIKNLIENAKITANKVITNKPIAQIQQFPSFEELAKKSYIIPKDNLWQYSVEDLAIFMKQMEDYITKLEKGYIDVCDTFNPIFNKFEMMENERKRLASELEEKETYSKQLEQAMIEMQQDVDNEIRRREIVECELEQSKKENQTLQSQMNWNQKMDENEVQEFKDALLELDRSQDEQLKNRIDVLQKEVQEQIILNKEQIEKIQQLQMELEKSGQENRQLNRNVNMLLNQLADIQSKFRKELEQKNNENEVFQQENIKYKILIEEYEKNQDIQLQVHIENTKLQDQIILNKDIINKKDYQITQLMDSIEEKNKEMQQYRQQIEQLKDKRDKAISEISLLSSKQIISDNSYTISVQKLKSIRFNTQNELTKMRKDFEGMYKNYLNLICRVTDQEVFKELLSLEKVVNNIVMKMQNLIDEIEDIMN